MVSWGLFLLRLIGGTEALRTSESHRPDEILFAAIWLGLSATAGIVTLFALFVPVTLYVVICVLTIPALFFTSTTFRMEITHLFAGLIKCRSHLVRSIIFLSLLLVPISFIGSQQVVYFDTAFYHLPMARILEEFGAIKGGVTIHPNFGQASSWFVLAAPGTAGGENGWGAQSANIYLVMFAATQAAFAVSRFGEGSTRLPDFVAGFGITLVLILAIRWGMIASLSPDLPAMLLAVIVAWLFSHDKVKTGQLIALPVAAFALTIKLSAAPLALMVGFAALKFLLREWHCILKSASLSILVLGPFVILGIQTSGCLAYPAGWTCLQLPWTPTPDRLADHANLIIAAARGGGRELPAGTSTLESIILWMSRDTSGAILVLGGWLLTVVLAVRRYVMVQRKGFPIWPPLFALAGLCYVTALAPSGRFAGGYTAILATVVISTTPWLVDRVRTISRSGLLPILFAVLFYIIHATGPANTVRETITAQIADGTLSFAGHGIVVPKRLITFDINQPDSRRTKHWVFEERNDIKATRPTQNGECWAAPPPCFPRGIHPNVRYIDRNKGISAGFLMVSDL